MRPAPLFARPPRDDRPALERAGKVAELRHRDRRDYSTFELVSRFPPGTLEALGLFDPRDYDPPDTGPAPMAGQTSLL